MNYGKHIDRKGRVKDVDEFVADDRRRAEAATAPAQYDLRRRNIAVLLDWLGLEVVKHEEHAKKEGINWGHVGDLGHLRQVLTEALSFLAQRDAADIERCLGEKSSHEGRR